MSSRFPSSDIHLWQLSGSNRTDSEAGFESKLVSARAVVAECSSVCEKKACDATCRNYRKYQTAQRILRRASVS